jgi:hypothetical protein
MQENDSGDTGDNDEKKEEGDNSKGVGLRKEKKKILIFRRGKKIPLPLPFSYYSSLSSLSNEPYHNLYDFLRFLSLRFSYICLPLEISSDVILSILPNDPTYECEISSTVGMNEKRERIFFYEFCKQLWLDVFKLIQLLNDLATEIISWSYYHHSSQRIEYGEHRRKESLNTLSEILISLCFDRSLEIYAKIRKLWVHEKRNILLFDVIEERNK